MIEPPTAGSLVIDGVDVGEPTGGTKEACASDVQIVFQDPYGSLNPRQKIGSILEEPLKINRRDMSAAARRRAALDMMARVGLRPEHYDRYPHMFSGGQRQRIAIARALMLKPAHPRPRRAGLGARPVGPGAGAQHPRRPAGRVRPRLPLHQPRPVGGPPHGRRGDGHVSRPAGRVRPREEIFGNPRHPYTRALLSATPVADPTRQKERIRLEGELPSPINPPSGCAFHPRCPLAFAMVVSTHQMVEQDPSPRKIAARPTRRVGISRSAMHYAAPTSHQPTDRKGKRRPTA